MSLEQKNTRSFPTVLLMAFPASFKLLLASIIYSPLSLKQRHLFLAPYWKKWGHHFLFNISKVNLIFYDRRSDEMKTMPPKGLYIANHQSFMDIMTLLNFFQIPPIVKWETAYIPFFNIICWASGAIFVKRNKKESRQRALQICQERLLNNFGVQIYPEGTRSKAGHPLIYSQIKTNLLLFCFNHKIPVIPCSIYGTSELYTPSGEAILDKKIGLIMGAELLPHNYSDAESFAKDCWKYVTKGHAELKESINEKQ